MAPRSNHTVLLFRMEKEQTTGEGGWRKVICSSVFHPKDVVQLRRMSKSPIAFVLVFFFALLKIACSSNRRYVAVSILCNNFYAIWNNFWWRIFENISSRSVWAKKREQKNGKNVNMNMIFSSYSVTQFDAHSPKAKNVFNCVALSHAQCTHRMRLNTIAHFMNMPRVPAATANTLVRSFVCMILYGFSARSVYLYAQFCFYGFALNKIWLL